MNEKQLRMINEALTTHIYRLEALKNITPDYKERTLLSSKIIEFEKFESDIEILLLRY